MNPDPTDKAETDELESAIEQAVEELQPATPPPPEAVEPPPAQNVQSFPPRHPPASLSQQWDQFRRVEEELRKRVRHERLDIIAEHDRLVAAVHSDYERRIDDAVAALQRRKDDELRAMADHRDARLREHDLLAQRMSR